MKPDTFTSRYSFLFVLIAVLAASGCGPKTVQKAPVAPAAVTAPQGAVAATQPANQGQAIAADQNLTPAQQQAAYSKLYQNQSTQAPR